MDTSPRPWRTGTKVHRTIYDANGHLIGVMDRPEDAAMIVAVVNAIPGPIEPASIESPAEEAR